MAPVLLALASALRSSPADADAVDRMIRGDQSGLAELYDRHGVLVFSLAMRILRNPGDAEDATQEAFVQIWRQCDRFDAARGSVVAWLLTITRARCIDLVRRQRARSKLAETASQWQPVDQPPLQEEEFDWGERAAAVREAMHSLPLLQRLAVELAFFDGLTHAEIAAQLEVPLGTVKTRVRQGLLRLKTSLGGTA